MGSCLRRCRVEPGPVGAISVAGLGPVDRIPNFCAGGQNGNGQSCVHGAQCASGYCSSFDRMCQEGLARSGVEQGDVTVMTVSSVVPRLAALGGDG